MSKIKNENFITIQGWMVNELNLKGNELLIYSVIYGFSQDGKSKFTGSLQYLADWCNSSKQTVINCLKSLCEKDLLIKTELERNGLKFCEYVVNLNTIQKICIGYSKNLNGYSKNLNSSSQKICTNNILKDNNKKDNNIVLKKSKKEKVMDKILAKLEEYDFSDKVKENILNYFSDRLDANDYPQANYLEMQLNGLSQHKESEQLLTINKAIQGQWKSMLYGLEKSNFKSRSGFVDTASRNITQEQREQERIKKEIFKEKLKNNDSSLHTF